MFYIPRRHPCRTLRDCVVKFLNLGLVEVEVGDERVDLDTGETTSGQVPLVGIPLELLDGDQHLDVVTAEQVVDPPGHGELEPAQAGHHQVDHEAGQGGGEQLTQHGEVIVTGPA